MEDINSPSTPGNAANFTDNETKLICAIMQNLTSEIQVSEANASHQARNERPSLLLPVCT
jgi:hypothetical protein